MPMTQIAVDASLARKLMEGSEVELCAPDGQVLGQFRSERLRQLYAEAECPDSPEELERRKREERGRTLDEIIADLEQQG
jgi:hypothetical protein